MVAGGAALAFGPAPATLAQDDAPPVSPYSYADLAGLADSANLVAKVKIRSQAEVEPERSPGLRPGHVRLYIRGETLGLLAGRTVLGESVSYLLDVPRDARGRAPRLRNAEVLLFANPVPGRPGELQLVSAHGQLPADPLTEDRLRAILRELVSPDAPPRVTGVRDSLSVEGNLAGESETQIFLDAQGGYPVSLTIIRRPGMAPQWGVSWTELVDQAARPPAPETLEWYRLACFLPAELPARANLTRDLDARQRSEQDYAFVLETLGPCERTLFD